MSRKIKKMVRRAHAIRRSSFRVLSEIKNGWLNYIQVPVSMIAYLSVIELFLVTIFPSFKNLSFPTLGLISLIVVLLASYYASNRIKQLRKFDMMS